MRKVIVLIVAAILLPLLLPVAAADIQPLAADVQHGIVVWDTAITLYKRGTAPSQLCQPILIGRDDVQRILGWGTDTVYAVIYVTGLDPYAGAPPQLSVSITTMSAALGNALWVSPQIAIQRQGVYEIPLPTDKLRQAAEATGGVKLVICLPNWNTDTANGAPDNYYSVAIDKVEVAPPQGAGIQNQQHNATVPVHPAPGNSSSIDEQRMSAILDRLDALQSAQQSGMLIVGVVAAAALAVALASFMRGRR